jgi:hypothetical protein
MLRAVFLLFSWFGSPPDLQACVHFWQRELNLQDWNVTLVVARRNELADHTLGNIQPDLASRSAILHVLRENDSDLNNRLAHADQCLTILHELVHLRRFAISHDPQWFDEPSTDRETALWVHKYKRREELRVLEQ